MKPRLLLALAFVAFVSLPANAEGIPASEVRSPDGRNAISVVLDANGRPTYSVARDGEPIIVPSPVLLSITSGRRNVAARHRQDVARPRPVQ